MSGRDTVDLLIMTAAFGVGVFVGAVATHESLQNRYPNPDTALHSAWSRLHPATPLTLEEFTALKQADLLPR